MDVSDRSSAVMGEESPRTTVVTFSKLERLAREKHIITTSARPYSTLLDIHSPECDLSFSELAASAFMDMSLRSTWAESGSSREGEVAGVVFGVGA